MKSVTKKKLHLSIKSLTSTDIFKGIVGEIYVDLNAQPKFFKWLPVPYAMRAKVEAELDRLQKEGIIERVK